MARSYVALRPPGRCVARLLIAGWCDETESARLFCIASDGGFWGRPFVAVEVDHYISSDTGSPAYQLARTSGFTSASMLTIAESQRAEMMTCDVPGYQPYHAIGGALVECEVKREGLTDRVVRTGLGKDRPQMREL